MMKMAEVEGATQGEGGIIIVETTDTGMKIIMTMVTEVMANPIEVTSMIRKIFRSLAIGRSLEGMKKSEDIVMREEVNRSIKVVVSVQVMNERTGVQGNSEIVPSERTVHISTETIVNKFVLKKAMIIVLSETIDRVGRGQFHQKKRG